MTRSLAAQAVPFILAAALTLARAVDDEDLSDEILRETLASLE